MEPASSAVCFVQSVKSVPDSGQVRPFEGLQTDERGLAGGKGATLARLYRAGYPVPDGVVILPAAFVGDELTHTAWASVDGFFERWRREDPTASFAVRSSALTEDSARASFAGQFETVLCVSTSEELRQAIRLVRRSRRSPRVQAYSRAKGIDSDHPMAVIVQRMVAAELSGVLFTVDPVTGDRDEMRGSFVRGLGDDLVSGKATGEAFRLPRDRSAYIGPDDLASYAGKLRRLGDRLERELGQPQDLEWAIADGELFLLQSRPITTLIAYNPATGEWNDSLGGDFLWSSVNFGEAVSAVMTPLTWTVIRLSLEGWSFLPGRHSSGNIGGRPYLNLSLFATVFRAMGRSTRDLLETLEPTVHTPLPAATDIPLLPRSRWSVLRHFPRWARIELRQRKGVRSLPAYLGSNPAWCERARERIRGVETAADLLALWRKEILPHLIDGVWIVLGSAAEYARTAAALRRELRDLAGPEDADALLSDPEGEGGDLIANLGPLVGIARMANGEMDREVYLERYGHRGPHEFELSIGRPSEDPEWLDRQVKRFQEAPVDVQVLLADRQARFAAAWERLRANHPRKARPLRRRIKSVSSRSRRREAARSEYVRDRWVVRQFALRAGELTGLGGDLFFLTIEELLEALSGNTTAFAWIPARKETHRLYGSLPPYPPVIRGRFDPLRWAVDPDRRSDFFDSRAGTPSALSRQGGSRLLRGAPGSAGVAEGLARLVDSPGQADQLKAGEILVTTQTDIEWTPLFLVASAIVTDVGAPFSHAAVVARELGIPAVVGCGDATMRLHTGDRVVVDGGKGEVRTVGALNPQPTESN